MMRSKTIVGSAVTVLALSLSAAFAQTGGTAAAPAGEQAPTIQQRKYNQQQRIANGIRTGQMTPGEAARTEGKEQGINREVAGMRQANGGKLAPSEHHLVNQQQNQASRQIYRQKHNGKTGF